MKDNKFLGLDRPEVIIFTVWLIIVLLMLLTTLVLVLLDQQ